jgi:hypothetical protein
MKSFVCSRFVAACVFAVAASTSGALEIVFDGDPFAGSTANPNDGVRTIVGVNERTLPSFNSAQDQFVFRNSAFTSVGELNFLSSFANALNEQADVIVLLNSDNDNNAATPFNAGAAASLIANNLTQDRAGFFIYFNSVLGVNRLVYSTNLNSTTADLSILARVASPTGADAIASLATFDANDFAARVPIVPAGALFAIGALGLAGVWRKRTV